LHWSAADGYLNLGFVHSPGFGPNHTTEVGGISADGRTIVGTSTTYESFGFVQHPQAFVWTSEDGIQPLGSTTLTESWAMAVSANGRVVSGFVYPDQFSQHAAVWTDGVETVRLAVGTSAWSISRNGAWVGGSDATTAASDAFIWSAAGGFELLGSLGPGSDVVKAVSDDGSIAVGVGGDGTPFRWVRGAGMQSLGLLTPGTSGYAWAMTLDGSIVVGTLTDGAFIWTAEDGLRKLQDVLENEFSLDLTGWSLQTATGISADGSTIVGYGLYNGFYRGFVVTVPEPSVALWLAAGFALRFSARPRNRAGVVCHNAYRPEASHR
jgi:uncharacterized membrane protein